MELGDRNFGAKELGDMELGDSNFGDREFGDMELGDIFSSMPPGSSRTEGFMCLSLSR